MADGVGSLSVSGKTALGAGLNGTLLAPAANLSTAPATGLDVLDGVAPCGAELGKDGVKVDVVLFVIELMVKPLLLPPYTQV